MVQEVVNEKKGHAEKIGLHAHMVKVPMWIEQQCKLTNAAPASTEQELESQRYATQIRSIASVVLLSGPPHLKDIEIAVVNYVFRAPPRSVGSDAFDKELLVRGGNISLRRMWLKSVLPGVWIYDDVCLQTLQWKPIHVEQQTTFFGK